MPPPVPEPASIELEEGFGNAEPDPETSKLYREILVYRSFPEDLLKGSGDRMDDLREVLGRRHRTF